MNFLLTMEYREVFTKGGKHLVYLAFDLLKRSGNQCLCPICKRKHEDGSDGYSLDPNYNKYKLNLKNDEIGRCVRCGSIFINETDFIHFPKLGDNLTKFHDPIEVIKLGKCNLHTSELTIDRLKFKDRDKYLSPGQFGMKYTKFFDRDAIFIPFNDYTERDKSLPPGNFYYQLRFLDNESPKYYMPTIESKPLYIPDCEAYRRKSKSAVLIEGIFDSTACTILYPDRIPIAVLGSYISNYQLFLLREYFYIEDMLIYFDYRSISEGVLNSVINSPIATYLDDIKIIDSDGMDPEEHLLSKL